MAETRSKVAVIWRQFLEESSFHGVKYFISKPNNFIVRLTWILFVFVMAGFLVNGFISTYNVYNEFEFQTKSDIKYIKDLKFPDVYICFSPNFDKNKVNSSDKRFQYLSQKLFNADDWNDIIITEDYLKEISFSVQDHIIYGTYNNKDLNFTRDFTKYYLGFSFPCAVFKPPEIQANEESLNSLILYIDIHQDRHAFESVAAGITMVFCHSGNLPEIIASSKSLSPGKYHTVTLSTQIFNYLPAPYNSYKDMDCLERKADKISPKQSYSYSRCMLQCLTNYVLNKCECITEFLLVENTTSYRYCSVYERESCVYPMINEIFQSTDSSEDSEYTCNCLYPCTETVYDQEISSMDFSSQPVLPKFLDLNMTYDLQHARKNLLLINIKFKNWKVKYIYHEPKVTLSQLVSDLGGFMGFYLGASVLTFIELIAVVVKTIVILSKGIFNWCLNQNMPTSKTSVKPLSK